MACGCNSTTSRTWTGGSYSNSATCPLPMRTSTPPTVPQRWANAPRFRSAYQARLVGVQGGDEAVYLDSPVDGVVMFDSSTGNSFVGQPEITDIPDYYGCTDTTTYGFPVYGVRPECGASAEFPNRPLGILRPTDSNRGKLWAHQRSCGGIGGPAQELTPVEIVPAAWPAIIPDGMMNLSFVRTAASECGSTQYDFYANPGQVVVPNANALLFDFPNRELTSDDDANFRFAFLVKLDSGHFILKTAHNLAVQSYIDTRIGEVLSDEGYAPTYLAPRQTLVTQTSNEIYNYLYGPFNMADYPGYNANSKEVQLFISSVALIPAGGTLRYAFSVKINNVEKYRSFAGEDPTGCHATGQVTVPMPANKLISIEVVKTIYATGPSGPPSLGNVDVFLEAFK